MGALRTHLLESEDCGKIGQNNYLRLLKRALDRFPIDGEDLQPLESLLTIQKKDF